jgi:hypothetical protein
MEPTTDPPRKRSLTSGTGGVERVKPDDLRRSHLNKQISVRGIDVTLGQHAAPAVQITGRCVSIRMNLERVVVTLSVQPPGHRFPSLRVVEVRE